MSVLAEEDFGALNRMIYNYRRHLFSGIIDEYLHRRRGKYSSMIQTAMGMVVVALELAAAVALAPLLPTESNSSIALVHLLQSSSSPMLCGLFSE